MFSFGCVSILPIQSSQSSDQQKGFECDIMYLKILSFLHSLVGGQFADALKDPMSAGQLSKSCVFCDIHGMIKALLARLPWGRRNISASMDGEHGVVYVECVSLIVSCYSLQ